MRVLKSLVLAVLLFASAEVQAQDVGEAELDTTVMLDTVANAVPDALIQFDSLTADAVPLVARTLSDSLVQRLRSDDAFWYANAAIKKPAAPKNSFFLQRLFAQAWFRNLLWTIIVASFVVVLLLFLLKSNIQLFHRKPTVLQTGGDFPLAENIFSIDYNTEITKAKNAGNSRLAVRLYYLQVLSLLSKQNIIQYKDDLTNSDYVAQLRQSPLYVPFKKLTRHFEYTWYGQFPVTGEAFQNIETDFSTFKNSIRL